MKLLENIEKRVEKWLISLGGLRVIFAIFLYPPVYNFCSAYCFYYLKMNSVENKEYSVLMIGCFAIKGLRSKSEILMMMF